MVSIFCYRDCFKSHWCIKKWFMEGNAVAWWVKPLSVELAFHSSSSSPDQHCWSSSLLTYLRGQQEVAQCLGSLHHLWWVSHTGSCLHWAVHVQIYPDSRMTLFLPTLLWMTNLGTTMANFPSYGALTGVLYRLFCTDWGLTVAAFLWGTACHVLCAPATFALPTQPLSAHDLHMAPVHVTTRPGQAKRTFPFTSIFTFYPSL